MVGGGSLNSGGMGTSLELTLLNAEDRGSDALVNGVADSLQPLKSVSSSDLPSQVL